jgi:hypothetical protein
MLVCRSTVGETSKIAPGISFCSESTTGVESGTFGTFGTFT